MKSMRRKEKEIQDKSEIIKILKITKYLTIAMCKDKVPYLVTLTHGYDSKKNVIYFHCAKKGKKIDILKENNVVWGIGRGSSVNSYVLYLIEVHDLDSVKFDLDINEFFHITNY